MIKYPNVQTNIKTTHNNTKLLHVNFCKYFFGACTMILKFIVACHVSTIPKSPPKIIRENTYTGFKESQFFFAKKRNNKYCTANKI